MIQSCIQKFFIIIFKFRINKNTKLKNANLSDTNMTGAFLSNSDLSNANLTNADLIATDLTNSDLTGSNFENTYLNHADLSGANLKQTKNLTREQIESTFITRDTLLPENLGLKWISDSEYEFN